MKYLEITESEEVQVRKHYNMTETTIKEYVNLVKQWMVKMPHLPETTEDGFIERQLLRNKFRIEQTKRKIDNYFTIRGKNVTLMENLHDIVPSRHVALMLPMPKLTKNLERISIIKMMNTDPDLYDITEIAKLNLAVGELMLRYDYAIGDRFVFDLSGLTLNHLVKLNPMVLEKNLNIFEEGFSCRIVGVDVLNAPSFANTILAIIKKITKPKIFSRIKFHDSLESLHEIIPPEHLPAEYGGTQRHIPVLLNEWDIIMEAHRDFFIENCKCISRENLRPAPYPKTHIFGAEGTFRQLAID